MFKVAHIHFYSTDALHFPFWNDFIEDPIFWIAEIHIGKISMNFAYACEDFVCFHL